MSALGIEMTDRQSPTTWTGLKSSHISHPLMSWAERGWLKASEMADDDNPDWDAVREMQSNAIMLERYAREGFECSCTERGDTSCPVCRAVAKILYHDF